jgi:hypothetical protein
VSANAVCLCAPGAEGVAAQRADCSRQRARRQRSPNIIRSYLARWLEELPEVQAFCVASAHHGGSGACYVALRKSAEAKQENWERHAKRSR